MNETEPTLPKSRKHLYILGAAAIIAFVMFVPAPKKSPKDNADERAAIAAIKSRYAPSLQLMAMNPDPHSLDWIAAPYPMCEEKSSNCWHVLAYVDVMPAAEKKTIKAEWIIDLSTGKDYPKNSEARLMYEPVESSPASTIRTDAPNVETATVSASSTQDSSGESSPTGPGTPFPEIHNSPGTICFNGNQCSDVEFAESVKTIKRQWDQAPEWLRVRCVSNHTGPAMVDCILTESLPWMNAHPGAAAPWALPTP